MNNNVYRSILFRICTTAAMICSILICHAQFGGGLGTEEDPWHIARPEHLNQLREYLGSEHNDKYYIQTADIDLGMAPWNEGEGWVPIGNSRENSFQGHYDGNMYVITGLTINRNFTDYQGLFGYINRTADGVTVKNLGLLNVDITGHNYVGVLTGYHYRFSSIVNCYTTGEVNGRNFVGGLAGYNWNGAKIFNSYSLCRVEGIDNVGGLTGANSGSSLIKESYSRGAVQGNNFVGGLVGDMMYSGDVIESYSTGRVGGDGNNIGGLAGRVTTGSEIARSYWDVQTSGRNTSAGGAGAMGRDTIDMVYPYRGEQPVYIGWDFHDIWNDDDDEDTINNGYPVLYYQELIRLEPPQPSIEITVINNTDHALITWEAVEGAARYKIYSSTNPMTEDWGDPIAVTNENRYSEPVTDNNVTKFYFVVAVGD